jgi:SAM-dependent methyltransferase
MKRQNPYTAFAKFYDQLMSPDKYEVWGRLIARLVRKHKIPRSTCLDVACGTGTISAILQRLGFTVIGVDSSREMLRVAKAKCPKATFYRTDIRDFSLPGSNKPVLAVSFYDSLNYLLSDRDLLRAFRMVNNNLDSRGIFLFDINTRSHARVGRKFNPVIHESREGVAIMRYGGKNRFWTIDIDFFLRRRNTFKRLSERHIEKGYDERDVLPLLKQANFQVLETIREYKTSSTGKKYLARLYFIAKKSG